MVWGASEADSNGNSCGTADISLQITTHDRPAALARKRAYFAAAAAIASMLRGSRIGTSS
jgi:hypothetical protein